MLVRIAPSTALSLGISRIPTSPRPVKSCATKFQRNIPMPPRIPASKTFLAIVLSLVRLDGFASYRPTPKEKSQSETARHRKFHEADLANSTARTRDLVLLTDSSYSFSGMESATTPAPACT